jgi:predicted aldo/keto reductase-like oxidoreductase
MIYRDFGDMKLSALGMGAMRLPVINGVYGDIDQQQVEKMVSYAMDHGINYYDTAYGYHDGMSEASMGRALRRYSREDYYLADKFPGYDLTNMDKVKAIFEEQLQRCGVEYFDFYLFHNVCEMNIDQYLDPKYGILDYLLEQKKNGRIRHLGFSAHGSYDVIRRFLDAYGEHMEFCQLQINYVDWTFQHAREKYELVTDFGIPVWVMEPLHGGGLCRLSAENEKALKALRPDESVTAWAFRFIQSLSAVKVTLSGMSDFEQMVENIETFETDKPFGDQEKGAVMEVAGRMLNAKILPCTACRYCTSHCPKELDIPGLLALYNEHNYTGGGFLAPMALMAIPEDKQPSECIGCRSCEAVCPQQLLISEALADFTRQLSSETN